LEVLKVSVHLLKRVDYLVIELNRQETYVGCAVVEDIDDFLMRYGFGRVVTRWWEA
jgi:hypothetical protein